MAAIIKIENLYKIYSVGKEKVVALGGINLQIEKGQICCILGTSGSGKSTLLNQLAGLEKPSKGRVLIGGVNISTLNEGQLAKFRQKNIGFIFQSYNLLQSYSALENVAMPLMFRGIPKGLRNRRAKMILKQVGLDKRMSHKPAQMSGGQQQRVGIARAFVSKPKIVFADEPTGNLDTRTTKEVMELIVRLCRKNNQTLVLVTHDRELALYAARIITLIAGKVVDDRPNQSIAQAAAEEVQPQEQEEGAHDFVIPILGKEKQEENNTPAPSRWQTSCCPTSCKRQRQRSNRRCSRRKQKGKMGSKEETEEDWAGSVPVFGDPDGRKRDGQCAGHHGKRGDRKKKEHRLYGASA